MLCSVIKHARKWREHERSVGWTRAAGEYFSLLLECSRQKHTSSQKRHGIVTEHASCFFTLEKFNMADALLLFMHGNCNIISLWTDDRSYVRQFFKLEMMFESNIDFSGFQRSHFGRRTLQKLNILIASPILDQTASSDGVKDWSRCFIKILSSVNTLSWTRHAEGGDLMVAGQ